VRWWQRWRGGGQPPKPSTSVDVGATAPGVLGPPIATLTSPSLDSEVLQRSQELLSQGDCRAAIAHLEAGLADAQQPARLHLAIGNAHRKIPDLPAAEDSFSVAVELDPCLGEAWLRLGEIHARLERYGSAMSALETALRTADDGNRFEVLQLQSLLLVQSGKHLEAFETCQQALAIQPDSPEVLAIAAEAAFWMGEDEEAIALLDRTTKKCGVVEGRPRLIMALAHRNCGSWAEARDLLLKESARQPGSAVIRLPLAHVQLGCCDWKDGWDGYGYRFAAGSTPYRPLPYKTWNGEHAPESTVVVLAEQGLGDEIMFASCLPDVISRVGHCIVECEPRLAKLFSRSFPSATVLPTRREVDGSWLDRAPEPDWQIFSGDLPALFRRRDEDFPQHQGYLVADLARVGYWRDRLQQDLAHGLRVGLSWRGGTAKTRMRARSLDCADLAPLFKVPGCQFVNLQYGDCTQTLQRFQSEHGVRVIDYPDALADYDETAALVCGLDLVVSVCTSVVHLAGALGRPAWVIAPLAPEWRYTASRTVMPWYPSVTIWRQRVLGDWTDVCRQVSTELGNLTISAERSQ
jgi:tetratricopeptide (TPR) repeat protein